MHQRTDVTQVSGQDVVGEGEKSSGQSAVNEDEPTDGVAVEIETGAVLNGSDGETITQALAPQCIMAQVTGPDQQAMVI